MATPINTEIDDTEGLEEVTDATLVDPDSPYESSESQLAADRSHHAKPGAKGGGPRKDGIKTGTVDVDLPIPTPRYRVFKSDSTNPNQSSKSGWNYGNTLPEWAKAKLVYYVYRDWPVLLDPGFDEEEEVYDRQYKYIDKISGNEPIQDDMDLLHRYGCGTYRVVAKDSSSKRKVDKPVFTVWVMNVGGADYKSNPPTDARINDVEQVDLNHPANKSYVAYLRGQGKLPEQLNSRQVEGEMAQVQIIEKLTDKMVQMAENTSTGKNKDAGVLQDAMKGAMDVMQKGAEAAIKTTQEANEYAAKVRNEAEANRPAATATSDPMMLALKIVELIHSERPAPTPGTDARYDALQAQLAQLQQSQIDRLAKQVETLLDAKVTGPAASTSPFSAMNEGLDSLEKFSTVMDRLKGGKEEGEDAVTDTIADAAPKWMRPILPILPGLAQGLMGWLQTRNQQPQLTYYQTADGRILPIAIPQVMPQPQQIQAPPMQWNGPTRPQQQFGPQPVPSPASAPAQDPIYALLSSITIPLLNNLQVNGTGTDFADWFIGGYGQDVYDDVSQLGPDTLFQAVSTFPPITSNPIYAQTPVEQVQKFITEFCDPNWPDEGEGEGNGAGVGTEPGTGPVPA